MKFRNYITLLSLACVVFLTASCNTQKKLSDTTTNTTSKKLSYSPLEKALLWKIEHSDMEMPSYLFGTIHMIDRVDFFLPAGTESAIQDAKQMYFEIDMDEMNNMGAQLGMMNKAFMNDGLTLKDLLTDEEYTIVSEHFQDKGLPMFMFERIKPMFLSAMVDVDMSDFSFGDNEGSIVSYEMEFYEKAQKYNMAVEGLETMEYQMSIFDSIPYDAQADMLVEAISSEENSEIMKELVDAYKDQNIEALVESIDEEENYADYSDMLLKNRNMNWIPVISEAMKESATFFAVGAGHLAGKNGVIHLLREEGFKLTPITEKNVLKKI